ncbi:ribonuclease H-like domain-containing protein [Trametes punicea]|nr:ribonuclease H-like domain-containing protein [Trametes punicea]
MVKSGKPGFYAVARGRVPGIYTTWDDCQAQTAGFPGNKHQKFTTLAQAQDYLASHGISLGTPGTSGAAATASSVPAPTTSRFFQGTSLSRERRHGSQPYVRVRPPSAATEQETRHLNSRWAALTAEIVQDESGWDVVYSDGACKGNGRLGSVAGIGVWWGVNDARNLSERCPGGQTNNRAELITTPHTKRPLLIKTDSKYSISCFRHWMPKWLQNNFRTASGEPVKNAPLIRYLSSLLDERARHGQKVHLQYVKGHAGHEGNEGTDRLANLGVVSPPEPERDWEALIEAKSTVRQSSDTCKEESSSQATLFTKGELEAYASALGDDDELLTEVING